MPVSEELAAILARTGIAAEFIKWLNAEGIRTTEDFALLATSEDLVEAKIVKPCKDISPTSEGDGQKVKITHKPWLLTHVWRP